MNETSIRYGQRPILQSVCAYGSETLVPNNDICRLSYYLKCCVIGCGINIGVEETILDYMNAHKLTPIQQEKILRYSFVELSISNLINRAFVLDDNHVLLSEGTLNTFFEFKTASTIFSINSLTIATGEQICVHKVMLCTTKWMREYYADPYFRYQQGNPLIEIHAFPVPDDEEVSYAVGGDDYENQGLVVKPIDSPQKQDLKMAQKKCCFCHQRIHTTEQPYYRCTQCHPSDYCEKCYMLGRHDQTHAFERVCRTSAESLITRRIQRLKEANASFVPDIPMAIAIPVEVEFPISRARRNSKRSRDSPPPGSVHEPCKRRRKNAPNGKKLEEESKDKREWN